MKRGRNNSLENFLMGIFSVWYHIGVWIDHHSLSLRREYDLAYHLTVVKDMVVGVIGGQREVTLTLVSAVSFPGMLAYPGH